MNRRLNILAAVAGAALAAAPVAAQETQAPTVTDTRTSGNWTVHCYRAQATTCEMTQVAVERTRSTKIASIGISYVPKSDAYLGRFGVPLGVSFEQGLGLEVGAFHASNLKYRICERDGCYVVGVLPPQLIEAMKSDADKGAMDVVLIDGRKFQIPIILTGFSDGLDLLKKWTVEKAGTSSPSKK